MNGVTYPKGFKAAGVSCGLKPNGQKDLALIVCEKICHVAGVFTKNIVKGHSLQLCKKNMADGRAKAIIINSGNANACLSQRGVDDALIQPYSGHESRKSLELYSKLSIKDCQDEYENQMKSFPI